MKRTVFCLLLCLSLCLAPLFGGCQLLDELKALNTESALDPEIPMMQAEKNGLRAAYFGRNLSESECILSNDYVIQSATALKQSGDIERYMLFSCGDDPDVQISQLEAAAENGFDVFLIDPCSPDVLKHAAQMLEEGRIAAAVEISDRYSHRGILDVSCSTERSDLAATEYICNAAAEDGRTVNVIMLTSDSKFGNDKRNIFLHTLESYPQFNVICDKKYSTYEDACDIILSAFQKISLSDDSILPVVLCDRIDSRLFMFTLRQTHVAPMFALSDRMDFLNTMLSFADSDGKVPIKFAAVNSPVDMPSTAMKIAVKLAQGEELDPSVMNGSTLVIDTYFLLTDEEFDSSSTTLRISDENYIATNILRNYLSEIFK
ncbi:MAG: hypothetical protein IJO96_00080 [Oscillospiraceae bacterium]|nr:hypothetical protein [Oscillospiraceae bacterium]